MRLIRCRDAARRYGAPPALSLLLPCLALAAVTGRAQSADRVVVTAPAGPSAQEIVRRAVANDALRHQHRLALECDQRLTVERLDEAGTVFKTKRFHLVHREGAAFAYFVNDGSRAARRASRDGDTAKAEHNMALMNLRQLAPRFDWSLRDEASVQGRVCYVVAFSPRRGQQAGTTEEKVIDQLRGRFWIDEKTFEILQGEGSLAAPVGVALMASVQQMSFAFHNRKLPGGEVAPADYSGEFAVKAPFYFFHQRQTSQLENWRPVPTGDQPPAEPSTPPAGPSFPPLRFAPQPRN